MIFMFNDFNAEFEILENNKDLQKDVNKYLIKEGLNPSLKGFKYFSDIVVISLVKKKYSKTFMCDLFPFIAHKYKIKEFSVQRQLRYTITLASQEGHIPYKLYQKIWFDFKMGKEKN